MFYLDNCKLQMFTLILLIELSIQRLLGLIVGNLYQIKTPGTPIIDRIKTYFE